jgi:hypothetical protein
VSQEAGNLILGLFAHGMREEIDYCWERLSEGGEEGQCGWLKGRYGRPPLRPPFTAEFE